MRVRKASLVLSLLTVAAAAQAQTEGGHAERRLLWQWEKSSPLTTARMRFGATSLDDGRLMAVGGLVQVPAEQEGERAFSAEIFDPATGIWTPTGSLALARADFTLSPMPGSGGEALIAVGGTTSEGPTETTEIYDIALGEWLPGPPLPLPFSGHSAVVMDNGALLVAGDLESTAAFVLEGEEWTEISPLLTAEPGSTLSRLEDDGLLLVGPNDPMAQRWYPNANQWEAVGSPAVRRSGHTATAIAGGLLIVGGGGTQVAEVYSLSTGEFKRVGATSGGRSGHTATRLADGRVAIVGGLTTSGGPSTEVFDPQWGTWTPGAATGIFRAGHQALAAPSGGVVTFGGASPDNQALGSTEFLQVSPPAVTITEYKLPAIADPNVAEGTVTELWASVARPSELPLGERLPVVLFLHGNHGTCGLGESPRQDFDCSYTESGVCPPDWTVVPSHRGYDYVAKELAARGYVVVSVNANRGITCGGGPSGDFGFNLARGRLLLRHLQQLSAWNRGLDATPDSLEVSLEGRLDLTQVGLMGHSRGGEGARAAYEQYREPRSYWPRRIGEPVVFRGIFEIGPVDGQTSRTLNADGTAWAVLLPMCDGDVSNLSGVRPFDRMLALPGEGRPTFKATYTAWGTNHNYFNTEWQVSDSGGCGNHRALFDDDAGTVGSAEQRQVGLRAMLSFFLGTVGSRSNPTLTGLFDPALPLASSSPIERSYVPSLDMPLSVVLEDFEGVNRRSGDFPEQQGVFFERRAVSEHDSALTAAFLRWEATPDAHFEIGLSQESQGLNLSRYTHLDLRLGRAPNSQNSDSQSGGSTEVGVQLVGPDGALSQVQLLSHYGVHLNAPVGGPFGGVHTILQSARLPLAAFEGVLSRAVTGVRLTFPQQDAAAIFLASIRVSYGDATLVPRGGFVARAAASVSGLAPPTEPVETNPERNLGIVQARQVVAQGNRVLALRELDSGQVELELSTLTPFRAQNDALVLDVGTQHVPIARHPDGDLRRVIFTVEASVFRRAPGRAPLRVRYRTNDNRSWAFGPLDKRMLQQP